MAVLPVKTFPNFRKKIEGLTLVEVLIALAIIGIAMTAVIKASSQNINGQAHLQNKMIAAWIGMQVINEVRTGLLKISDSESHSGSTYTLGRNWRWEAKQQTTGNPLINRISVKVFENNEENQEKNPLIQMESYLYAAQ